MKSGNTRNDVVVGECAREQLGRDGKTIAECSSAPAVLAGFDGDLAVADCQRVQLP